MESVRDSGMQDSALWGLRMVGIDGRQEQLLCDLMAERRAHSCARTRSKMHVKTLHTHHDVLGLQVLCKTLPRAFPAKPTLSDAPKGRIGSTHQPCVDTYNAYRQVLCYTPRLAHVTGVEVGAQAHTVRVRGEHREQLLLVGERSYGRLHRRNDRSESEV